MSTREPESAVRVFSRSAEAWFEGRVVQLMDFNIAPARGSRDEATRDAPPGAGTKQTLAIAGTRTRRAARDEDQIALELAEAESRREALEEDLAREVVGGPPHPLQPAT